MVLAGPLKGLNVTNHERTNELLGLRWLLQLQLVYLAAVAALCARVWRKDEVSNGEVPLICGARHWQGTSRNSQLQELSHACCCAFNATTLHLHVWGSAREQTVSCAVAGVIACRFSHANREGCLLLAGGVHACMLHTNRMAVRARSAAWTCTACTVHTDIAWTPKNTTRPCCLAAWKARSSPATQLTSGAIYSSLHSLQLAVGQGGRVHRGPAAGARNAVNAHILLNVHRICACMLAW
jgi:hypothetical protein